MEWVPIIAQKTAISEKDQMFETCKKCTKFWKKRFSKKAVDCMIWAPIWILRYSMCRIFYVSTSMPIHLFSFTKYQIVSSTNIESSINYRYIFAIVMSDI